MPSFSRVQTSLAADAATLTTSVSSVEQRSRAASALFAAAAEGDGRDTRRVLLDNFLRRQLDAGAVSADRVSLIKIQSEDAAGAAVPFALLPLDATLAERIDAALDDPRSHGPYLPALSKLVELVTLDAEE